MNSPSRIRVGLERCLDEPPPPLHGARFGLVMNQASVDHNLRYACDVLAERLPGQLAAIFSPQHGLWGEQQANMIESRHVTYEPLDLPVYSLYSETRRPTAEMLQGLDCLVLDLQDVGTRVYTFVWTMLECLRACAEAGLPLVLFDRPNPIGGEVVEGPVLNASFRSFVGNAAIPLRHGLTLGELARLFNAEERINADLHVVPMEGWRRSMLWPDTGRTWVWPSPNMQRFETAVVYPGQVLLEGTNISEGRGTTLPFEVAGAPYLNPHEFVRELERFEHPGLRLRPLRFLPTFDKWLGKSCGGVALQVVDPPSVRSVATTVALIAAARSLAPKIYRWLPPPYEYEYVKPPIDILFGSAQLRACIDAGDRLTPDDVTSLTSFDVAAWQICATSCRLYA
jgi:uncharacterized protein YbbC (DUF1343 family)